MIIILNYHCDNSKISAICEPGSDAWTDSSDGFFVLFWFGFCFVLFCLLACLVILLLLLLLKARHDASGKEMR